MSAAALVVPAIAVFAAVACLLALLLRGGAKVVPMDRPNERSLHSTPIPRIGGMVIMAVLVPVAWWAVPGAWAWGAQVAVLAALSAIDDVRGLPVRMRLAVQAAVAAWAVAVVLSDGPVWVAVAAWFATVWMTNLYNFMDGSDGLAGGMAVAGFGAYALAAWWAGDAAFARACLLVVAAAGAFLLFNFHPARVFMGDAGSVPLGLLAAVFGLQGWRAGHWSVLFPLVVFSPFVADATVTLLRRLLRGEKVWQAHRTHYYQRLVQLGAGHRRTALLEYLLMAAAAGAALWGTVADRMPWAAAAVGAMLLAAGMRIDAAWRARRQAG